MPRALLLAALLAGAANGYAQPTFKCKDNRGGVTYSSEPCDKQGLKDSGPIPERITTMPLGPAPKAPAKPEPAKKPDAKDSGAAQLKPLNPLIEKLSK